MITDLDVIVKEWAYRVNDGKPNPNNSTHLYHLSEILIEYKWPYQVIDEIIQNLVEQETKFKGRTKDGKLRYFKTKDSLDKALEKGTVEPIKEPDKKDDEPQQDPTKLSGPKDFERPGSDTKSDKETTPEQDRQSANRFKYADYELKGMTPDDILTKISSKDSPAVVETKGREDVKRRTEKHRKDVFDGKRTGKGTKETTIQEELANISREIAIEKDFKEPPPLAEQIVARVKRDYPDTQLANDDKTLNRLAKKSDAGVRTMRRLKNNPKWGYKKEQPDGHPIHTTDSIIVRDDLITKLKQAEKDGDEEAAKHYRRELYFFQKKAADKSVTGKEGDADTMIIYTDNDGRTKVAYISNKQTILDQLNSATLKSTKDSISENAGNFFEDENEKQKGIESINKIVDEQYKKASKFNETYTTSIRAVATNEEKRKKLREPGVSKALSIAASVDQGTSGKKKFIDEPDEKRSQKYTLDAQKSAEVQAVLLGEPPAPNNDPKSKEYKEWKKGITEKWKNKDKEYGAEETIQAVVDATGTGNLINVGTGSRAAPYSMTRATIVTRDLRNRVQKLVDDGMSVKEACEQVANSESKEGKLYGGKFSAESVEEIYNSDELKELEEAERKRGQDISGMYDETTKQLRDEDAEWAKRNDVDDVPPKNGPYTKAYVQGWLNRTHLSDMIRGTFEGKSLMEIGSSAVSAPDFRRSLAELTEFDGDPDDVDALEQHILDNVVPSQDGQNLVYVNKNNEEIIIGQDTHRTDGRTSKVVGQYSARFGKATLKYANENEGN